MMTYTKKQFTQDGYDIKELSDWAYLLSLDKYREIDDSELENIIYRIHMMQAGPEFELSEEELLDLANELDASK